jgi:hypothetical protein
MNDLKLLVCQKTSRKVKKVFAQNKAVTASERRKLDCHRQRAYSKTPSEAGRLEA